MADTNDITLPTADLAGTKLSEGDGARVVKQDGNYELEMLECNIAKAKNGSDYVVMSGKALIKDTDEVGGVVYFSKLITGEYTRGEQKVKNMQENFGKLLLSVGKTQAFVDQIANSGNANFSKIVRDEIVGKTFYAAIRTGSRDGDTRLRSEPAWFISKEKYTKSRQSGVNFRLPPRPAPAPRGASTNGTVTVQEMADGI